MLRSSWLHAIVSSRLRWRALDGGIVAAQEGRLSAQPGEDLGGVEHVAARGRQLDREREAVEEPAELDHRRAQRLVERPRETGSIAEQLHGGIVRGERCQPPDPLTSQADRLAARGHHLHPRTGAQELVDVPGDAGGEVLAVVHDQQGVAIPEVLEHRRLRVPARPASGPRSRRRRSRGRAPGR